MWIKIILAAIVLYFLKYHWSRRKFYYVSWKIHGPTAFPIIGSGYLFLNDTEIIPAISKLSAKYLSPMCFWLGPRFVLYFDQPKDVESILTSSNAANKGDLYKYVPKCLGGIGLFASQGEVWKLHRKLLNPTIQNYNILNSFYPVFNKNVKKLINILNDETNELISIDMYKYLEAFSFDTVCETTFGTQINVQKSKKNLSFLHSVNTLLELISIIILQPWYQNDLIFRLSKYYQIMKKNQFEARDFITNLIQKKITDYQERKLKNDLSITDEEYFGDGYNRHNFIDECLILALDKKVFTIEDVIGESMDMMIGGFDTTATTVNFVVLMLAMHPEYQEKVFNEILEIFDDKNDEVTAEDISKMKYTDRFIKETLRLYPVVPLFSRIAKTKMEVGSINIPVGTEMAVGTYTLHRNKTVWGQQAEFFNPDNFLPDSVEKRPAYSYIPFSGGIRNCIGLKYAHILIRILVCHLVRNFRFSCDDKYEDIKLRINVSMKLAKRINVYVHKRS